MKTLIVEDDAQTVEAVSLIFKLRWPGAELISTDKGTEAATMVEEEHPDIVILDLGLPDMDGADVLKEIRVFSNVPVIIVTGRGDPTAQVKGLELGADDYITKPFEPGVLLARVKNALRHSTTSETVSSDEETLVYSDLIIDFAKHQITRKGESITLTPTEYNLFYQLVKNEGRVLTHQTLLTKVWGEEYYSSPDLVKKYIRRLREKIEENPNNPMMLISEWGVGYKFVNPYPKS